mmetsp:Transcript_17435/g.51610  ORF Transcript_17435/g.51610 Transcript_17435/m.51610 type:complete len:203 (+) Transcript_17435:232-840(+)
MTPPSTTKSTKRNICGSDKNGWETMTSSLTTMATIWDTATMAVRFGTKKTSKVPQLRPSEPGAAAAAAGWLPAERRRHRDDGSTSCLLAVARSPALVPPWSRWTKRHPSATKTTSWLPCSRRQATLSMRLKATYRWKHCAPARRNAKAGWCRRCCTARWTRPDRRTSNPRPRPWRCPLRLPGPLARSGGPHRPDHSSRPRRG